MKLKIIYLMAVCILASCNSKSNVEGDTAAADNRVKFTSGYSMINGLKMYYEIYGEGNPLVLIHGGGSTIQTSFGRIIPELARTRRVIGVELQAHGRTNDRDNPLSFEQDADDVASLLQNIGIPKADFFGFSNGGSTAFQIAIRHPQMVNKIIAGSTLYKRNGVPPQFWEFMKQATLDHMPQQYKDAYMSVAPDPDKLSTMNDKCAKRMAEFKDWSEDMLRSISAPTLLIIGDKDLMTPEHAVEMYRIIPECELAIIPGGHGEYIGEIITLADKKNYMPFIVPVIEEFLDK